MHKECFEKRLKKANVTKRKRKILHGLQKTKSLLNRKKLREELKSHGKSNFSPEEKNEFLFVTEWKTYYRIE